MDDLNMMSPMGFREKMSKHLDEETTSSPEGVAVLKQYGPPEEWARAGEGPSPEEKKAGLRAWRAMSPSEQADFKAEYEGSEVPEPEGAEEAEAATSEDKGIDQKIEKVAGNLDQLLAKGGPKKMVADAVESADMEMKRKSAGGKS